MAKLKIKIHKNSTCRANPRIGDYFEEHEILCIINERGLCFSPPIDELKRLIKRDPSKKTTDEFFNYSTLGRGIFCSGSRDMPKRRIQYKPCPHFETLVRSVGFENLTALVNFLRAYFSAKEL